MTAVDALPYAGATLALLYILYVLVRKMKQPHEPKVERIPISDLVLRNSPALAEAAIARVFPDFDHAHILYIFSRFRFTFSEIGSFGLQPNSEVVNDLVRKVFSAQYYNDVVAKLNEYGVKETEIEPGRVRVDIIKVSGGDHTKVAELVSIAKSDFRDLIVSAEEPNSFRVPGPVNIENIAVTRAANDADLRQFVTWLLKYVSADNTDRLSATAAPDA